MRYGKIHIKHENNKYCVFINSFITEINLTNFKRNANEIFDRSLDYSCSDSKYSDSDYYIATLYL